MKIATWNVNSLNVRLPHVLDWLQKTAVDVLCLQELKLSDDKFPVAALEAVGYRAAFAGQKTYNGVAILTRTDTVASVTDIHINNPGFTDEQRRLISATVDGMRIICAYMPNGGSLDSDKFVYKQNWLQALLPWIETELDSHPALALLGDFNIAPEDRDVWDPLDPDAAVLIAEPVRARFRQLLDLGLADAFRLFDQPEKSYSWWDYRNLGFRLNRGLRIDHILLSAPLAQRCVACHVDRAPRKLEKPSDHAPVLAEI